jgi:predicted transcriptional regulator
MNRIIIYPNFAGVDIDTKDDFDYPVKNISLDDLLPNEKHKNDDYFSSVEMKQYLDKMSKDIDNLDPIIVIKNPLNKEKYNILDGHHRYQVFKKLNNKTIPTMVVPENVVFLAKDDYGVKNNKATRLDKINTKDFNLNKYFNTSNKKMLNTENEMIKGGLADNKTLTQISKKHSVDIKSIETQLNKGIKVEMEHTNDKKKAKEIAMDHLWEDPKYYNKLKKIEAKEMTDASSSGSFSAPAFNGIIRKKDITKVHNMSEQESELAEVTDASSSGSYDVPFGGGTKGRKDPLKIGGPDTIYKGRAVKDKNFPKWGGPGGKFVKIKDKCKKYPYCNQGDINALELMESEEMNKAINEVSIKMGINRDHIKSLVLKEIKDIFI